MDNEYNFNSKVWWEDIKDFAERFVTFVNKQSEQKESQIVLKIQPKEFERVKHAYFSNLQIFKRKVYGKNVSEHRIDRHKIIALYIKSFLEISPFYTKGDNKYKRTTVQSLPNEYFSLEIMNLIITAWNQSEEGIRMDENEKKWFIILLNHYRLNINTLDVLSLAQIIYYIEDKYIRINKTNH
ncbi:hypothetical protein [Treponema sp. R80B11-R83G3]